MNACFSTFIRNRAGFGWTYLCTVLVCIGLAPFGEAMTFEYETDAEEGVKLTRYTGEAGDVTVPAEIDGNPVRIIGNQTFRNLEHLTRVVLPDSVTVIEDGVAGWHPAGAFSHNPALIEVTLGNGLARIGDFAFFASTALRTIHLPESVTHIGRGAFCNAAGLASVTGGAGLIEIGDSAFEMGFQEHRYDRGSALRKVAFGDRLQRIGNWAFQQCAALETVALPDSLESIGHGAFRFCAGLRSVHLGSGIRTLGRYGFSGAASLARVRFAGDAPETVGAHLFFRVPDMIVEAPAQAHGWSDTFADRPVRQGR